MDQELSMKSSIIFRKESGADENELSRAHSRSASGVSFNEDNKSSVSSSSSPKKMNDIYNSQSSVYSRSSTTDKIVDLNPLYEG